VAWHGAPAGSAEGKSRVAELWNAVVREDGRSARIVEGDAVYSDGTHVVGVLEVSGGGDAKIRQANILHLNEEGKASAMWTIPSDDAVAKALEVGEPIPEHPNLVRFRAAEEARARNEFGPEDLASIVRFLREDVRWNSPWGGGPSSRDEVVAQFGTFNEATGGSMQLDLNEVFADDTHAVSLVRLQADRPDRPGKHMDVREANVFHLDENGQAYEFWGVAEDQSAINAFWT
jgi:hypothetical protein